MKRHRLHIVLAVLLWIVFGYYWSIVVRRPINEHTRLALAVVGTIVAVIAAFAAFWISHNIRLARRHDRRHDRRKGIQAPERDYLGRDLISRSEDELTSAPYIEVYVVEVTNDTSQRAHKVFHIPDGKPEQSHG